MSDAESPAPRRNPKRARTGTVSYKEPTDDDDENLIGDDEIIWKYDDVDLDAVKVREPFRPRYHQPT